MLIKYHKWSKKPRASTVFVRDKKSHFLKKTYWISIVKNDKGSQNCIRRKMHINMFKNDMHVITHSAFSHEVSVMEKTQNFGYDEKSPYFWRIGVFENKKPSEFPFFADILKMDNIKNPIYLGLCLGIDILVEIGSTKGGTLCLTFSKFVRHIEKWTASQIEEKRAILCVSSSAECEKNCVDCVAA